MRLHHGQRSCWSFAGVLLSAVTGLAQSTDWPQWGGPHRDFKSDAKGLAASWPSAGPRRLWSRALGEGYSSIAVVSGTLYTMYRRGDREVVIALEAESGKTLWERAYEAPFIVVGREAEIVEEYHLERGLGPHSTPLIVGNYLFAAGATGGSIMAFNQEDGKIVWQRHDYHHAYASPSLIDVDGEDQLVTFMRDWLIGVDPDNGDLRWSYRVKGNGTNVSTPVWGPGNLLFMSAHYGVGTRVLRLTRAAGETRVEEVWRSPRVRLHFANAIRIGEVVYGSSGAFGPAFFTAIDVTTGNIIWQDRRLARASFIYADGRFIMIDEDGTLVLATPSAEGLNIHSQLELLQGNAWTIPTLVGKILYVRDRKTILALDLD